jgi:hypothetical protein
MRYSKNLPWPLFTNEGYFSSLWQREVGRDFVMIRCNRRVGYFTAENAEFG